MKIDPAFSASALQAALPVKMHTLENGLKILMLDDHAIPNIALYLFFRVGSRNEHTGITGLSHFLEHMMFNGARKYGPGGFDRCMESAGGRNNAFTSRNVTAYQDWFPSNAIELAFDLESDRMAHLALVPESFESERGVVASERRLSTENDNLGLLDEQLWATAYTAHPYQWPIIGWMVDIQNWRLEELQEYFRAYYAPNNAIMVLVGDFDSDQIIALAERYFQPIPSQPAPRRMTTREPPQMGERRVQVKKAAQLPSVFVAYHVPETAHPDFGALQVMRAIMLHGQSSRLYHRLVDRDQMATSVGGGFELSFDPTLFHLSVQMKGGFEPAQAEEALYEELERLSERSIPPDEFQKAQNILLVGFFRGLKTINGKANLLGNYSLFLGSYQCFYEVAERIAAVTPEDVQRVARLYFHDKNRTVATLVPENHSHESTRKITE